MPTLERKKLYEDIWSRPATTIAKETGITSVALKKICEGMDIPTPPPGYWTKVQCGKTVKIPPLPKANSDTRLLWDVNLMNSRKQRHARNSVPPESLRNTLPDIRVAKDLKNLHPLVANTRIHLQDQWSREYRDNRRVRSFLHVRVSKSSLDRSLLFLDALVRGLEDLGLQVCSDVDDPKHRKEMERSHWHRPKGLTACCWVDAHGERVSFRLGEHNQRVSLSEEEKKRTYFSDWKEVPSGRLFFSIEESSRFQVRTTWRDGKIQRIEKFLTEMVATFHCVGEEMRKRRIEREERERRWAAIEEIKRSHDNQRWREEKLLKKMFGLAEDHQRAKCIRNFLSACRSRFFEIEGQEPELLSRADLWMKWMEIRVDMMDPLQEGILPWNMRDAEVVLFPNKG